MLPFFKAKSNQTGVIVKDRQPNEPIEESYDDTAEQEELEEFVKDLLVAFSFKDVKKIAQSIKIIHDVLHMHMEGDSQDNTNYALQNARANKSEQE